LPDERELLQIPVLNNGGSVVRLGDIAVIERKLKDERIVRQ